MAAATTVTRPAYPLKASANNRYLVDQDNVPFLMVGDSPQALIGNLSPAEAAAFIANRLTYGINALWINLLCNASTGAGQTAPPLMELRPLLYQAIFQLQTPPIFGARTI
jgi:hypothetical protein